jgi:beta-galactosidase
MINELFMNNQWIFTRKNESAYSGYPIQEGEMVSLPHCWNDTDGQGSEEPYYRGTCWYQHTLSITSEMAAKHHYLEIGAAGNIGQVYINGILAGESRCGYAMFRVPLTPHLQEGDNLISIQVTNDNHNDVYPLLADFTFYGGLYRYVKLVTVHDIHFDLMDGSRDGVYVTPMHRNGGSYELTVHGQVLHESSDTEEARIQVQLLDHEDHIVLELESELQLEKEASFRLSGILANPILWDGIEQPYLYHAEVSVSSQGIVRDRRRVEIGFRTVEVTADKGMLLNGKPVKLNGVCRHQDFGEVGNAITQGHMDTDMAFIREVGANSIRLAHYQHDDYFYSLCDRYGLLVWAEIPYISIPSTKDPESRNAFEQLEKLIKQAYNHTSIYCWGVQNEITIAVETDETRQTIQRLVKSAKKWDPSRYTAQANINGVENGSIINSYTEVVGYNLYYGWYYGEIKDLGIRLDEFHRDRPETPVLVSEYGVDTNPRFHSYSPEVKDYTEEYQLRFHQNALETFESRPFVLGGYVWNMFDFGSANRNEGGETGKNLKGLVTIDRTLRKDTFYLYKAHWSKEPFVHMAGRRFVNRHRESNDITVLSNVGKIRFYLNGELLTEVHDAGPVRTIRDVRLMEGENVLRVEGYDSHGQSCTDEMLLRRVPEQDDAYIHVKEEQTAHVVNWFERFDLSESEEVVLKQGYYSTFDTIEALYSNEAAKAVFLKYFGHVTNHPFFEVTIGVMSIEKMAQLEFYHIPPELLPVINKELNAICK